MAVNGDSYGWVELDAAVDTKGNLTLSSPGSAISNPSGGIVGAATKTSDGTLHGVLLVPIQLTDVISDQISGNEANKLPDGLPYTGDANNPILMAACSGTTANIAVKVTTPPFALSKILVAVRKVQSDGNGPILGSTPAQQGPTKTLIQFTAEEFHASNSLDTSNLYEVVAGYDANGDGVLSKNEIAVVFAATDGTSTPPHDKFRVVTKSFYDSMESYLESISNDLPTGYSGNFLNSFLTGSAIPGATLGTFDLTSTYPGLSHPLGAVWATPGNDATAVLNTFGTSTAESLDTADSNAVNQIIDATLNSEAPEMVNYFVQNPNTDSHGFTYSFLPSASSVDFVKTEGGTSALGLAFGKVTLNGIFTATVSPLGVITSQHQVSVTSVNVTGNFSDVYDFNYYGAPLSLLGLSLQLPLDAASVQAGYATLSSSKPAGRVYQSKVNFQTTLNWNKTYTANGN